MDHWIEGVREIGLPSLAVIAVLSMVALSGRWLGANAIVPIVDGLRTYFSVAADQLAQQTDELKMIRRYLRRLSRRVPPQQGRGE